MIDACHESHARFAQDAKTQRVEEAHENASFKPLSPFASLRLCVNPTIRPFAATG